MGKVDEKFLIDRIRAKKPMSEFIVPESFPVTSFGDVNTAKVFTVGINPSVDEFRSRKRGRPLLEAGAKRFVDRESLGLAPSDIPSEAQAREILLGNHAYFKGKPYHWFNWLQTYALNAFGLSFVEGSAAHVDLVQWATAPVWSQIDDKPTKETLVRADREFLRELIHQKEPELVLLNGKFVVSEFERQGFFSIDSAMEVKGTSRRLIIFEGTVAGSRAIGWNMNIQAQNTKADRERLLAELKKFAN